MGHTPEDDPDWARTWKAELDARLAEMRSGGEEKVSLADVRGRLEARRARSGTDGGHALYSSLLIEEFRCFAHFELRELSRINLIVGANGSGKTTLLEAIFRIAAKDRPHNGLPLLVPTRALPGLDLIELLPTLFFAGREHLLRDALRIIDDRVEDLSITPSSHDHHAHLDRVVVGLRGKPRPVSVGSLGEGAWRLLTLATAMASAAGGVVLVDNIDIGLHYSVMASMWRHVATMATGLDVQVFATSHSRDCYEALSTMEEGFTTIHRIERGRTRSVVFHGAMVAAAAANDVEIR